MGWSSYKSKLSPKEVAKREFEGHEILGVVSKGREVYVAARQKDGKVAGWVVLVERSKEEVSVKVLHECELPYYFGAPKKILDLLDETQDENSLKWRKFCRDSNFEVNQVVRLPVPVKFSDGVEESEFQFVKKNVFLRLKDFKAVSIKNDFIVSQIFRGN